MKLNKIDEFVNENKNDKLLSVDVLRKAKELKSIGGQIHEIKEIKPNKKYILSKEEYERYGGGNISIYMGSGKEILQHLAITQIDIDDEDDVEELIDEHGSLYNYLSYWFNGLNGDGEDYHAIYEI